MVFQKLGHRVSMAGMGSKVGILLETSFSFSYLQGFQQQPLLVVIIVVATIKLKVTRAWRNVKGEKATNETHV
jgi:hypothetical protein